MENEMLVLSRKLGERVLLYQPNGDLLGEVEVLEIRGLQVRLGFTAPQEIAIWRPEIDPHQSQGGPAHAAQEAAV